MRLPFVCFARRDKRGYPVYTYRRGLLIGACHGDFNAIIAYLKKRLKSRIATTTKESV